MSDELHCPKCGGVMDGGFLLDRHDRSDRAVELTWIEAARMKLGVTADPTSDGQVSVDAFRCTGCGYLELYAGVGDD